MNNIPELTPNANIIQGAFDETIRLDSINVTDIKVTQSVDCDLESMAPNNIESIGAVKL